MTLTEVFTDIADAIRTKKGTTDKILATNFATEILNLPSSGGGEKVPITSAYYLFYRNSRNNLLENINNYFDFTNTDDFYGMFENCDELTEIPQIDTSNGTNFYRIFYGCESLTEVPQINTSKGTNFAYMFASCESLTEVPQLDTSKGINFSYMFNECNKLTEIPQINTSNGTNFAYMFSSCDELTKIPQLDTSKGTTFAQMFASCKKLTEVPQLDASLVNNCIYIFYNCSALTTLGGLLNLGKAYTQKTQNYNNYKLDLSKCTNLTHDSLMNIINDLCDLNLSYDVANGGTLYAQSLVLGSTNLAKLTAEEIAIATKKGWNVS